MKKTIYTTLLLSSLLLAGCQGNAVDSETDEQAPEEDTTEQVDEQENETETEETEETSNDEETTENEEAAPEDVTYEYQINPETFSVENIEETEATDEQLVLLTFDDAPYGNTLEIAEALNERDVSAIFFVNSMYMDDEEGIETIQEVHEMGFEIGNHTHTHAKLDDYTEEEQREEILTTNEIIEDATGEKPRFFRAPHGVMTDYSEQLIADESMTWMNWSFGYDWQGEYQDPAALTDITLNTPLLGDGANILMHDREWTAAATPDIVDGLIEDGFTIVDPKLITHE